MRGGGTRVWRGHLLPLALTSKGSLSAKYYHEVKTGKQNKWGHIRECC